MPTRLALPAFTVLMALACMPRGGNDEALTPVVRPGRWGTYAVSSVHGTQVAAFEVEESDTGWALQYLGASDSAGVLSYQMVRGATPEPSLPLIRGTQMVYFLPALGSGVSSCNGSIPNANGVSLINFGCQVYSFPEAPAGGLRGPRMYVSGSDYQWMVFVSATAHLTDDQWQAVADSLRLVSRLTSIPDRLGVAAFRDDRSTRWMVTVTELALHPTQDSTGTVHPEAKSLRWSGKLPAH